MHLFLSLFHCNEGVSEVGHECSGDDAQATCGKRGASRLDISAIVFHLTPCAMPLLLLIMISITYGFQVAWPCRQWTLQFNIRTG